MSINVLNNPNMRVYKFYYKIKLTKHIYVFTGIK